MEFAVLDGSSQPGAREITVNEILNIYSGSVRVIDHGDKAHLGQDGVRIIVIVITGTLVVGHSALGLLLDHRGVLFLGEHGVILHHEVGITIHQDGKAHGAIAIVAGGGVVHADGVAVDGVSDLGGIGIGREHVGVVIRVNGGRRRACTPSQEHAIIGIDILAQRHMDLVVGDGAHHPCVELWREDGILDIDRLSVEPKDDLYLGINGSGSVIGVDKVPGALVGHQCARGLLGDDNGVAVPEFARALALEGFGLGLGLMLLGV